MNRQQLYRTMMNNPRVIIENLKSRDVLDAVIRDTLENNGDVIYYSSKAKMVENIFKLPNIAKEIEEEYLTPISPKKYVDDCSGATLTGETHLVNIRHPKVRGYSMLIIDDGEFDEETQYVIAKSLDTFGTIIIINNVSLYHYGFVRVHAND